MTTPVPDSTSAAPAVAAAASPPGSPPRTGLAGAALLMAALFLLSRVTGLAREMVISAQFGTSTELDAYLAAFRVPDLLFQMVAGGALGSAFIPIFAEQWDSADAARAWQLFSRVLNLVLVTTAVLGGLAALFAQPLVEWTIARGFAPDQQLLTANLMRWMMISTTIFAVSGLLMGALNALHHFLLPGAAPIVYNLLIIVGAWWLAPHYGVYGLVIGVVAGALAHLAVQLPALWRKGARYRWELAPAAWLGDADVRRVLLLMGPRVLGIFFVQMHFLVNTILASGLDAGSLSALNFAWLLMLLPLGLFAQSVATVAFPALSAQIAVGDWQGMADSFVRILRIVIFLTVPAAFALFVLRVPLVQAVFERREFGPESTQLVAFALQFYALGLVAHAVVEIAVRAFYAMHDTWTPVRVGIGAMILNIALSFWWVQSLSFGGLALANTTATTIEMVLLLWLARRRLVHALGQATTEQATGQSAGGAAVGAGLLGAVGRSLAAGAIMAGAVWWMLPWLAHAPWQGRGFAPFLDAGLGLMGAALVYLAASALLRSQELAPALALVLRRRRQS
ncbi:MAG: murein biosynthesis integral membrane protein MurJ [Litorilinea sp.]